MQTLITHAAALRAQMRSGTLTEAAAITDLRSKWDLTYAGATDMLNPDGYWRDPKGKTLLLSLSPDRTPRG